MKIIDLTLQLHSGMSVYPGDPEPSIEIIQTIESDGWNMRRIEINSHDGTHVNAPIHGVEEGKTLDDYQLTSFVGPARLYEEGVDLEEGTGVIFRDQNIDRKIADWIKKVRPHFVGLSSKYEVDTDIEKEFLQEDIMLYERLTNTDDLPEKFMFYGVPLKIKEGDGSPVRAFAVVED
jgi:arylformamidase